MYFFNYDQIQHNICLLFGSVPLNRQFILDFRGHWWFELDTRSVPFRKFSFAFLGKLNFESKLTYYVIFML